MPLLPLKTVLEEELDLGPVFYYGFFVCFLIMIFFNSIFISGEAVLCLWLMMSFICFYQ